MFTKTERLLISVIITAAVLAILSLFLSDPNEVSAKEIPVVTWVQHEPVYHENTEVVGQMPQFNMQKFTNSVPCGGGNPPVFGGTDAQCKDDSFCVAPAAEGSDYTHVCSTNPDRLTKSKGIHVGPSGRETWYSLPMSGVIEIMRREGFDEECYPYWVCEGCGCKMLGQYIMVAADVYTIPRGTIVETSLGLGIVADHCVRAQREGNLVDIAVSWK